MSQAFDLWRRGFSWKAIRPLLKIHKRDLLLLLGVITFTISMFGIVALALYAGQARAAEEEAHLSSAWEISRLRARLASLEIVVVNCLNNNGGIWVDDSQQRRLYGCRTTDTGFVAGDFERGAS